MLNGILDGYLSSISRERDFDAPFYSLLYASGFHDIHFTHGAQECGKDFIAKRTVEGLTEQWAFQNKCGNISLTTWRNELLGQMRSCDDVGLSHPNFDNNLPRQSVLVTTGTIAPSVLGEISNLRVSPHHGQKKVEVWSKPVLIDMFVKYGLESLYQLSCADLFSLSEFYVLLGHSIKGELDLGRLESLSRTWIAKEGDSRALLFSSQLVCSVLQSRCSSSGLHYEALHCQLVALRTMCWHLHRDWNGPEHESRLELARVQLDQICVASEAYCNQTELLRAGHASAIDVLLAPDSIITYPVLCLRYLEVLGMQYFLTKDQGQRVLIVQNIRSFIDLEPGASHPISDKYAVSIVPACLALVAEGYSTDAIKWLLSVALFVCDRYENGFGLASCESSCDEEVSVLLGYPFDFINVSRRRSSFLATVIVDLAAHIGDEQFFADLVNEFWAYGIVCEFYRCGDDLSQFEVHSEQVVHLPAVSFSPELRQAGSARYGDHLEERPVRGVIGSELGFGVFCALSLVLRDRYFVDEWGMLPEAL